MSPNIGHVQNLNLNPNFANVPCLYSDQTKTFDSHPSFSSLPPQSRCFISGVRSTFSSLTPSLMWRQRLNRDDSVTSSGSGGGAQSQVEEPPSLPNSCEERIKYIQKWSGGLGGSEITVEWVHESFWRPGDFLIELEVWETNHADRSGMILLPGKRRVSSCLGARAF